MAVEAVGRGFLARDELVQRLSTSREQCIFEELKLNVAKWKVQKRGGKDTGGRHIRQGFCKKSQGVLELYPDSHRETGNDEIRSALLKDHSL